MPYITSFDDTKIYYEEEGRGQSLLLLHGSPGQISNWKYIRPNLATMYHVITPDLRGYGQSDKPKYINIRDYLKDLDVLLDVLSIKATDITIIGHSFGSMIAMEYAASRDVKSLVMISPALEIPKSVMDWFILHFPSFLWKPVLFSNNLLARNMYRSLFFSPKTSDSIYQEFINDNTDYIRSLPPQTFRYLSRLKYDGSKSAKNTKAKTLIIVGEDDRITPPENAKRIAEFIKGAKFKIIPEAGHMILYEKPKEIVALITDFLDGKRI